MFVHRESKCSSLKISSACITEGKYLSICLWFVMVHLYLCILPWMYIIKMYLCWYYYYYAEDEQIKNNSDVGCWWSWCHTNPNCHVTTIHTSHKFLSRCSVFTSGRDMQVRDSLKRKSNWFKFGNKSSNLMYIPM